MMRTLSRRLLCLAWLVVSAASQAHAQVASTTGQQSADDDELVAVYQSFLGWRQQLDDESVDRDMIAKRVRQLQPLQQRLQTLPVLQWHEDERHEQVADYLAVRAELDEYDFMLQVSRPWLRDPGWYVDRMLRVAFTELPVQGDQREALLSRLQQTRKLSLLARSNLTEAAADYADLALHALANADGVGHGHPRRPKPPAGVIGWYQDLLQRAEQQQPELMPEITAALQAVREFQRWLQQQRPRMTAAAGVGRAAFDWYLKQVKMLPYDADDILLMSRGEFDRLRAFYTLERHRNRELPELELAESEADYLQRIGSVDADVRAFIEAQKLLTVPDYVPTDPIEMGFNAPWILRPGGPNYWENIQFRDPSPDHWHAVIPGHRFDSMLRQQLQHPIRKNIHDGVRAEGWAVYLEEMPLQLGFYAQRPRTRELIYNFGLFRAVRSMGDVMLQLNRKSTSEVMQYWMQMTPGLDENVARVDAEIYLRRPPGYGIGYTIGHLQLQQLLADVRWQQGDDFVLGEFHDRLLQYGWMPIALIRHAMTGHDDEVSQLLPHQPVETLLDD